MLQTKPTKTDQRQRIHSQSGVHVDNGNSNNDDAIVGLERRLENLEVPGQQNVIPLGHDLLSSTTALFVPAVPLSNEEAHSLEHLPVATAHAVSSHALSEVDAPQKIVMAPFCKDDQHQVATKNGAGAGTTTTIVAQKRNNNDIEVATVVAIPGAYSTPNVDAMERQAARIGTERGRQLAQQEVQDILNHNRYIPLRNFAEEQRIREQTNVNAIVQNYKEETGLTQTSATIPLIEYKAKPEPKSVEHFLGTFGKEYDVSEYQTKDYDTTSYETSEYKSLYES